MKISKGNVFSHGILPLNCARFMHFSQILRANKILHFLTFFTNVTNIKSEKILVENRVTVI